MHGYPGRDQPGTNLSPDEDAMKRDASRFPWTCTIITEAVKRGDDTVRVSRIRGPATQHMSERTALTGAKRLAHVDIFGGGSYLIRVDGPGSSKLYIRGIRESVRGSVYTAGQGDLVEWTGEVVVTGEDA